MLIRLFQPQDSDRIAKLFHDTVREVNIRDYSLAQVRAWAPDDIYFTNWTEDCTNSFTYVAEEKDEVIGFAQLDANGHIDCFFCHKDYQRCGVGTRLYRAIEAKALELQIERLFVEVSITARAFFKSRGFAVVKEHQVFCRGENLTNFVMEKYLGNFLEKNQFVVATFYHFAELADYQKMRSPIKDFCDRHQLKGVILLAQEGINSTIAGSREGIDELLGYLRSDPRLQNLEHKETTSDVMPYNTGV